jgi:hypothetical protein
LLVAEPARSEADASRVNTAGATLVAAVTFINLRRFRVFIVNSC